MTLSVRTKKTEVSVTVERDGESCQFTGIPLDPKEATAIEKKHERLVRKKGQVLPESDFIKIIIDKAKATITGWPGLVDENGEPVPFDKDTIEDLYLLNSSIVTDAVGKFAEIGRGAVKPTDAENIEKN